MIFSYREDHDFLFFLGDSNNIPCKYRKYESHETAIPLCPITFNNLQYYDVYQAYSLKYKMRRNKVLPHNKIARIDEKKICKS